MRTVSVLVLGLFLGSMMIAPGAFGKDVAWIAGPAVELTPVGGSAMEASAFVEGRFTVGFFADPPVEVGAFWHGGVVESVNDAIDMVSIRAVDGAAFVALAGADPKVRYVEQDVLAMAFFTPNDPQQGSQWAWGATPGIDAYTAWDTTLGSTATTVAVLDSGVDFNHPDKGTYLTGWDFVDNDNDPQDCDGHGTHVAGTVGAKTNNGVGVAGTAQTTILPGRALDCSGSGSFTWIANAITWAADSGADIISMSLGCSANGCFHQGTADALQYAVDNGVLPICAAGNSGPKKNSVEFPGNDANCMAVSNVNSAGGLSFSSSQGAEVEIAAPGSSILSTCLGGGYCSLSGTSMAAPHVSGVGALALTQHSLTGAQLRQHLKDTAVNTGLKDTEEGAGIVNAANAVANGQDPQCSDGIDNDGDGLTDYPADPGCSSAADNDETDPPLAQCQDGIDNDGDGLTDYPADPGCSSASDDDETDLPPGADVHTHDIDSWRQGQTPHFKVWAFDALELGVDSVDVFISVDQVGGGNANGNALTGSDGTVTFKWQGAGSGTYTTCVTNMVKASYIWDSGAGHASSGNCHTEAV